MKNILKVQKDGVNTLKEIILSHSNNKLKKIYIIAGNVKETGYDIVEECLIDLKARKFLAFGIDKKNTTRKILESAIKFTKNVYVWDNNDEVEFNSNIFVFEYEDEAKVYGFSGSITDSMLETDFMLYNEMTYDLIQDKKEYEIYITEITKCIKDNFKKLEKEYIDVLAENKLIFTTKQYVHSVPSIAELLGKKEETKKEEVKAPELPKFKLDVDALDSFEIDLSDYSEREVVIGTEVAEPKSLEVIENEEIETEAFGLNEEVSYLEEEYEISDEVIDMEAMVLESEVVKIDKKNIKKKEAKKENKKEEKQLSKKINLEKVSNIIMELAKKPSKGKDITRIKIPNYIKDMIPNFFEAMEDAVYKKTENGEFKEVNVKLEIIDVNNGNKFVDENAKLSQKVGQTYIEFDSIKLEDVMYEEMDIARIIKLSKNYFHIEIIPNGIEEYNLWDKLCTNTFKGSSRQYGLM